MEIVPICFVAGCLQRVSPGSRHSLSAHVKLGGLDGVHFGFIESVYP